MTLGENLRILRKQKNMTQKELGGLIGATPVTIGNWERGAKQPSLDYLMPLAEALGVNMDTLFGYPSSMISRGVSAYDKQTADLLRKYQKLDKFGRNTVDMVCNMELARVNACAETTANHHPTSLSQHISKKSAQQAKQKRYLPYYNSPAAAGISAPLEGNDFEMLLADENIPPEADYAVRIAGDSMEPYINDGDMVFVKEGCDLSAGEVGIFCVNGEMFCKQLFVDKTGNLHLLSANAKRADTNLHISPDSGASFRCCGKVLLDWKLPLPEYFKVK